MRSAGGAWLTCWGIQVKGSSEADPWALVYWKNPPTCYKNRQVPPQHFEGFRNKVDPWPCSPPRQELGDGSFHTNPASEGHCNTEIAWGEKTFPACLHAQQVLLCQKDKAPNPLICLLKFYQDFQHWKMHLWPGTVTTFKKYNQSELSCDWHGVTRTNL